MVVYYRHSVNDVDVLVQVPYVDQSYSKLLLYCIHMRSGDLQSEHPFVVGVVCQNTEDEGDPLVGLHYMDPAYHMVVCYHTIQDDEMDQQCHQLVAGEALA